MANVFSGLGGRDRRKSLAGGRPRNRKADRRGAVVARLVERLERREMLSITDPTAVGTKSSLVATTSLVITVPNDVPINDTLLVAVVLDGKAGAVSATDSKSHHFRTDLDSGVANGLRTVVLSAPITGQKLMAGETITITVPSSLAVASVIDAHGLLTTAVAADQTAFNSGTDAAPTTGATPAQTSQAEELLFGAVGFTSLVDAFTPAAGFTAIGGGAFSGTSTHLEPAYQVVGVRQPYTFSGTLATAAPWSADLVTYKAAPDATPPTVVAGNVPLDFVEKQTPKVIDANLAVSDADNVLLKSATVAITGNFAGAEDVLGFATQNGITGSYDTATGVLSLTGVATVNQYRDALRSVTYEDTSNNPSTLDRTVSFSASDFGGPGAADTQTVTVTAVDDRPVIVAPSATQTTDSKVSETIAGISVSDVDAGSADIVVTLTAGKGGLTVSTSAANGLDSQHVAGNGTGTVTLTGSQTAIDNTLLAGVSYLNGPSLRNGGTDTLTINADDKGHTGNGPGSQSKAIAATVPISVTAVADLAVTVSANPATGLVGQPLTYTVTLTNNGPSDSTHATLVDTLPAGVHFESDSANPANPAPSLSGNQVSLVADGLASGASVTLTIVVTPQAGTEGTTLRDSATYANGGPELDRIAGNDKASVDTPILAATALSVSISASPTSVYVAGQTVQISETISNLGPNTATGAKVRTKIPAGFAVISSSPAFTPVQGDPTSIDIALPDVVNGSPATVVITLMPMAGAASLASVMATIIPGAQQDVNSAGTHKTASVNVATVPAVILSVSDSVAVPASNANPAEAFVGQNLVYTIVVRNNDAAGTTTARNIAFSDLLPAHTSIVSASDTAGNAFTPSNGKVSATIASLAPQASDTITITLATIVDPNDATYPAPAGVVLTDGVSVSPAEAAIDGSFQPVNKPITTQTSVTVKPQVGLKVGITATATDPNGKAITPFNGVVDVRGTITYVVSVMNQGPSTAHNVVLTDTLPSGVTLSTQDGLAVPPSSTATDTFASLAPGQTATMTLVVTVNQAGTLVDTAVASANEHENSDPGNTTKLTDSLTLTSQDVGAISLDQASYTIGELDSRGYLPITVSRSGTSGQAGVTIELKNGTGAQPAVFGVNYGDLFTVDPGQQQGTVAFTDRGTKFTVTLATGVASRTLYVPILDDLAIRKDAPAGLGFNIVLSNPTGGVVLSGSNPQMATIAAAILDADSLLVTTTTDVNRTYDTPPQGVPAVAGLNIPATPSPGSFRYAIAVSNKTPGIDTITFGIKSNNLSIEPNGALPAITDAVVIDGTTQAGPGGVPLIGLDGRNSGNSDGLLLSAGVAGSTIQGLAIGNYAGGAAIHARNGNDLIRGNFLGLSATGVANPNAIGLLLDGSSNDVVLNNVISANAGAGIDLRSSGSILIQGNKIGTGPNGRIDGGTSLGNAIGIAVDAASTNNTIGGAGAGTVISAGRRSPAAT